MHGNISRERQNKIAAEKAKVREGLRQYLEQKAGRHRFIPEADIDILEDKFNKPGQTQTLDQMFEEVRSNLSSWKTFWDEESDYLRCEATEKCFLEECRGGGDWDYHFNNLVLQGKIPKTPEASARDWEKQKAQDEIEHQAKESTRMISEITGYMLDASGKVKFEYQRQYKEKIAGLRAMTFSDLVARYGEVTAARALQKAPVEAARASVWADKHAQEKTLFSNTPPEVELLNPSTNQPFTRKELVNYLNSLSREETRAFFSFPSGKPKPGVAEAATRILKGVQ
jgi:hypothetical protein